MKLLLFGGTFDPPHNGHVHLLQNAIAAVGPDRVVVMPAGTPPHKAASATPARWRLEMCRCFLPLHENLVVSDWEIKRAGKSYTVDTLAMLRREYPDAELFLCMGSDMLTSFTEWRDWQTILKSAALVVQSRTEGDDPELQAAARALEPYGGRVIFTRAPAVELASSDVRAGRLPDGALPPLAAEAARRHHLYGR